MANLVVLAIILLAFCSVIYGFRDFGYDDYNYYDDYRQPFGKKPQRKGIKNYGMYCEGYGHIIGLNL